MKRAWIPFAADIARTAVLLAVPIVALAWFAPQAWNSARANVPEIGDRASGLAAKGVLSADILLLDDWQDTSALSQHQAQEQKAFAAAFNAERVRYLALVKRYYSPLRQRDYLRTLQLHELAERQRFVLHQQQERNGASPAEFRYNDYSKKFGTGQPGQLK